MTLTIALLVLGFVVAPLVALALCWAAGQGDRAIERHAEQDYGSEITDVPDHQVLSMLGPTRSIVVDTNAGEALAGARGRNKRAASRRTAW